MKPRQAAITSTMVYFGMTILTLLLNHQSVTRSEKYALCWLFPTIAMAQTVKTFVTVDQSSGGVNFESWTVEYEHFSVQDGFVLMFFSGLIVLMVGIYLEQVLPKTYGQKRHPCFMF